MGTVGVQEGSKGNWQLQIRIKVMAGKNKHRQEELAKRKVRIETGKRLAKLPFTQAEESVRRR